MSAEVSLDVRLNIAASSPYMHDGRFDTLSQVIAFSKAATPNSHPLFPAFDTTRNSGTLCSTTMTCSKGDGLVRGYWSTPAKTLWPCGQDT